MRLVVVVTLLATLLGMGLPAAAYDKGDTCTLKAPLMVTINTRAGKLETSVDPGTEVEVTAVGDEGRTRISTGDAKGSVATRDLEAACAGTLQMCRLSGDLLVYEKNSSDTKSWKLKKGAPLSVLRTGKVWAHVRVDDLEGFAKAAELKGRCDLEKGATFNDNAGGDPPVTDEVERGEGPGVLFLPFLIEGAAPVGDADQLAERFFDRLAFYRPDTGRLGLEEDAIRTVNSPADWKKHVAASAARARAAGLAYVVVAKVGVVPLQVGADADAKAGLVVSLAVVDAASGATVKGLRARPSMRLDDPWAENVLSVALPLLRSAPAQKTPPPVATPKKTTTTTNEAPTPTEANATDAAWPWFANPWGYAAAGVAVAAGVGSGVVGALANVDNDAANAAAPVDDARSELRSQAFTKAVASDSLAGVAGVAAVAAVVVFATRTGLSE